MITEVTKETDFQRYLDTNQLILADFYTTWCEPCRILDEVLARIAGTLPLNGQILKIDSEKLKKISGQLGVMSAPVLILFKNGKEIWRMNGFKMDQELMETIDEVSRETGGS